jgi:hypothetical protein
MKRTLAPFCLIAALAAAPASAAVVTLLDNTSAGLSTTNGLTASSRNISFAFTVGSSAYTLKNLEIMLALSTGSTTSGDLTVELFAGAGGQPTGFMLVAKTSNSLTLSSQSSGLTSANKTSIDLTTGSTGSWQLLANQSYALVFSSTTSTRLVESAPDTLYSTGSSGLTYVGRSFSGDNGASWDPYGPYLGASTWMKLTGETVGGSSSVPDAGPGPALALLLGGLGVGQWRRTRRTGAAA